MASEADDADQFIAIGRVAWFVSKSWNRLHAVPHDAWTSAHRADITQDGGVFTPIRLACGRTASRLFIPGVISRLSLPRCKGCCKAAGLPGGTGSPKNSPACQEILGLTRKENAMNE